MSETCHIEDISSRVLDNVLTGAVQKLFVNIVLFLGTIAITSYNVSTQQELPVAAREIARKPNSNT